MFKKNKLMNSWIRQLFCKHEQRELVVTGAVVTVESVVERCSYCRKQFGKPRLEV